MMTTSRIPLQIHLISLKMMLLWRKKFYFQKKILVDHVLLLFLVDPKDWLSKVSVPDILPPDVVSVEDWLH